MRVIAAIRAWMRELEASPARLKRSEWTTLIAVSLAVAATRLLAIARSPWDWDEMLFILAVRDYDVAAHHPHPPGFPLFIGAAKLLRLLTPDEFTALQAVAAIGAMALFPLTFLLVRELRADVVTAFCAAALMAFFPNVWLYGGAALSDVPSVALCVAACALLLWGIRAPHVLFAAGCVAGCAIAFRPQNAGILLVPFAIALLRRTRAGMIAAALAITIAAASFGAAAIATGPDEFLEASRLHQRYIASADSFLAPGRPSLIRIVDDFFVRPYRNALLNVAIAALVLFASVRALLQRRIGMLVLIGTFGPFSLFAWLFLDWNSASRFSIGYMPLYAVLAADALRGFGRRASIIATIAFAGVSTAWMLPALREIRGTSSPPVAAVEWLQRNPEAAGSTVYVQPGLVPYFQAIAPRLAVVPYGRSTRRIAAISDGDAWFVAENAAGEKVFSRARDPLWNVARHRYFDVSITRVTDRVLFGSGWYGEEGRGENARRWASRSAVATLPPIGPRAVLTISLYTPVRGQRVAVLVDGALRAQGVADGEYFDREFIVETSANRPVELRVVTDRAAAAPRDARELAMRLESLTWSAE